MTMKLLIRPIRHGKSILMGWVRQMNRHVVDAKMALAEPIGESPPFIIEGAGLYLVKAQSAEMTFSEIPWKAARMSKEKAIRRAATLSELTGYPVTVRGWREETERFIHEKIEMVEAVGG